MFTGIIKDIGTVAGVVRRGGGLRLRVRYRQPETFRDLMVDESVSLNGACQTVVEVGEGWFEVDTIEETLKKTTLGSFLQGTTVNLERAVRPIDRLGGHFVLGHIDCTGTVREVIDLQQSREIRIGYPDSFDPYIVPVGSIAVDGVSLTVAHAEPSMFAVAVIPFTFAHTTINSLRQGSVVNLEFDILGKYVARQSSLAANGNRGVTAVTDTINENWLREHGF
jgi:riboflavin synthase